MKAESKNLVLTPGFKLIPGIRVQWLITANDGTI